VIAHDMGAPVLKVPVPAVEPGAARVEAVARVVSSVGVPVLFLGGPRVAEGVGRDGVAADPQAVRDAVLAEVRDVMTGGAAGLAIGRALIQDPEPGEMARQVAEVVHGQGR
jgi:2-amino-4,5-dihydroxy-6-oxo-7-(phosphonooxy)heptanoate synthase